MRFRAGADFGAFAAVGGFALSGEGFAAGAAGFVITFLGSGATLAVTFLAGGVGFFTALRMTFAGDLGTTFFATFATTFLAALGAGLAAGLLGALRAATVAFPGGAFFAGAGRFAVFAAAGGFRALKRAFGLSCGRLATARTDLAAPARALTLSVVLTLLGALAAGRTAFRAGLATLVDLADLAVLATLSGRAGLEAFLTAGLLRAGAAFGRALVAVSRDLGFSVGREAALRAAATRAGLALARADSAVGADFALPAFLTGAFVFTFAVTLRIC